MRLAIENKIDNSSILSDLIGKTGFVFLLISLGLIIYFDDIQITVKATQDLPTIYNIRFAGIKLLDFISIGLFFILTSCIILKDKFKVTEIHKNVFTIFSIYCIAAIIGFIYSFWLKYDYLNLIQDFQQVLYLTGFFLYTYYFVDSKKKWKVFSILFVTFLVLKNYYILYKIITGEGIIMFTGLIRASQNSEFSYFPILFFTLLMVLFHKSNIILKLLIATSIFVYLVIAIVGMVRTVWVILFFGIIYLLFQLDKKTIFKIFSIFIILFLAIITGIFLFNPTALEYLWEVKLLSIFVWDYKGRQNLSNAMRMVQISNVWDWVIAHYSFIQGMGLGAWWEDNAREMLPNITTEYQQRSHYRKTDIWAVTQFLKIGLVGMFFYWRSILRIIKNAKINISRFSKDSFIYKYSIGLLVGFVTCNLSNADHVRLFLIMGVLIGLLGSLENIYKEEII